MTPRNRAGIDPDLYDLDHELLHEPGCRRPGRPVLIRGARDGRVLAVCRDCNRGTRAWLKAGPPEDARKAAAAPEPTPTPAPTPKPRPYLAPTPPARYVCRDHPDQPVDHRGKGCATCTTDERTNA